jgi:hypothetical protein
MKKMLARTLLILLVAAASPSWSAAQQAATSVLVIQCTPGGAQVYVDDMLMGTTNAQGRLRLMLKSGSHVLRLSHDGYGDWNGTVKVVVGHSSETDCELPQAASGDGSPASASSGPSLAETLDLVSNALGSSAAVQQRETGGEINDFATYRSSLSQTGSCLVTFTMTTTSITSVGNSNPLHSTFSSSWSVNLSDIDPSSVKSFANMAGPNGAVSWPAWGYSVQMALHDMEKKITLSDSTGPATQVTQVSGLTIYVTDDDTASRLVQALSHAVALCGGKKSAF